MTRLGRMAWGVCIAVAGVGTAWADDLGNVQADPAAAERRQALEQAESTKEEAEERYRKWLEAREQRARAERQRRLEAIQLREAEKAQAEAEAKPRPRRVWRAPTWTYERRRKAATRITRTVPHAPLVRSIKQAPHIPAAPRYSRNPRKSRGTVTLYPLKRKQRDEKPAAEKKADARKPDDPAAKDRDREKDEEKDKDRNKDKDDP